MPPGRMEYTLVGFSAELDWRPLRFVKPIPLHRVCEACGLVRNRAAVLPCRHTLCESCYELSTRDGGRVCPLDGLQCEEEDVDLKEFPVQELLRRKVKCWNEGSACSAVLTASQIGQHFRRECQHHSIRCPKCSARVIYTDVCAHLESECCTTTATPAGLECLGNSDSKEETALLTSLEAQAGELKALMERVLVATGANGDRLNEVVHGVNSCQEALREELRLGMSNVKDTLSKEGVQARTEHRDSVKKYRDEIAAVFTCQKTLREELRLGISSVKDILRQEVVQVRSEHRESLKKCSDEITGFREDTKGRFIASSETMNAIANCTHSIEKLLERELTEKARGKRVCGTQVAGGAEGATEQAGESSSAMSRMDKAVPKQPDPQASVCEFVVKGVKSLVENARKEGLADYESGFVYLRGYCMSPCVRFKHWPGGITELGALFRLHKGDMDDVVQWPFEPTFKFRVVHPKGGEERESERYVYYPSSLQRPQEGRAQDAYWTYLYFNLEGLIRRGYVENDQLRLKLELLP